MLRIIWLYRTVTFLVDISPVMQSTTFWTVGISTVALAMSFGVTSPVSPEGPIEMVSQCWLHHLQASSQAFTFRMVEDSPNYFKPLLGSALNR